MNGFDAAVYLVALVALVAGFNAGLLRSAATILGYLSAMPIAVAATQLTSAVPMNVSHPPWAQNSLVFFAVFLGTGVALGAMLRMAVSAMIGPSISLADRLAGSLFGALRIGLVAVTKVLIFDRLIPVDQQPAFLNGSRLRPIFSMVARTGLKSLPPDIMEFVDQLKKDRRA
jgi:membrane protein required for colicin V production